MTEIIVPDNAELLIDSLGAPSLTQVNRSAWTRRRKVIGLGGSEMWRATVRVDLLATEDKERPWRAFLFNLKGPQNWFKLMLPPNSHYGARPTVASGAGNGYTLPLTGLAPNARILRAGDFMTVPLPSGHARAVSLAADLRADGSGDASAQLSQALNETPTTGATVETAAPYIPVAPTDPLQGFDYAQGVSGFSFSVEEAL